MGVATLSAPSISFEEFLEQYDGVHCEWVDGKVIEMSPVSRLHQDIGGFLFSLMKFYAAKHDLGQVYDQTFLIRLPSRRAGREPDVMFVSKAKENRLRETYSDGAADMIVEIVSPDSIERDHVTKLQEYEDAGIPEYWIIDGWTKEIWFYQLDDTGHYQQIAPDAKGIYRCFALPGFWIDVNWLWQNPLPLTKAAKKLRVP